MDFKASLGVLAQAALVTRGATREINGIGLRHESGQCSWSAVDLFPIVCEAGAVDVKTGQDLRNRFVKPQHNLNVAYWVLADNSDRIFGSDGLSNIRRQ